MYIIRADGNAKIGAGHLMRCLTIAEEFAKRFGGKREINFFCADEESAAMAENSGFQAKVLGTDYRDTESELGMWKQLVREMPQKTLRQEGRKSNCKNTILVDSYYVTDAYLDALRQYGKVYLLDDLQEHAYPVDTVINYNAFADEAVYAQLYAGAETECLIGSRYVPVRQQFLNRDYGIARTVQNVLITTGGGDQDNIAGEILKTIYREGLHFHVVTGRYNPHLEELKKWEKTCPGVTVHHDVSDMAGLMQKCDMAVTAGGTTIYELASVGVPFLCFSYAKNQEALTKYIGENQIAGFLGEYHLDAGAVLDKLRQKFTEYCENYDLRKSCSERERQMIDGKGAARLADELYSE